MCCQVSVHCVVFSAFRFGEADRECGDSVWQNSMEALMSTTDQAFVKAYRERAIQPPDHTAGSEAMPHEASNCQEFRPAYQVDRVAWPAVIDRVSVAAADQLDRLADGIVTSAQQYGKRIGFFGLGRSTGCTMMLLAVARRLIQDGRTVALVDACPTNPQLASWLALCPAAGWDSTAADAQWFDRTAIEALDGRLRVLPLVEASQTEWPQDHLRRTLLSMLPVLASLHSMVLVDFGAAVESWQHAPLLAPNSLADVALLVFDRRRTPAAAVACGIDQLRRLGVPAVGAVENFAFSPPISRRQSA